MKRSTSFFDFRRPVKEDWCGKFTPSTISVMCVPTTISGGDFNRGGGGTGDIDMHKQLSCDPSSPGPSRRSERRQRKHDVSEDGNSYWRKSRYWASVGSIWRSARSDDVCDVAFCIEIQRCCESEVATRAAGYSLGERGHS